MITVEPMILNLKSVNLSDEQFYQLCHNNDGLFVTLYAKSTDKMPRQHTSNPKIPKVSKAIASPFY